MGQVTLYKCDKCGGIIQTPEAGLVVQGNIYVADPETRGGLIGNNFSTDSIDGQVCYMDDIGAHIKESVYCVPCFLSITLPTYKLKAER